MSTITKEERVTHKKTSRTHGHAYADAHKFSPTYMSWVGMKARCNPSTKTKSHQRYYAGVTYCDRWKKFENFLADMGERPDGHSLDRVDSKGGYCPENCRWATYVEQSRNTSRLKLTYPKAVEAILLRLEGVGQKEIGSIFGCDYRTVASASSGRTWKDAHTIATIIHNEGNG